MPTPLYEQFTALIESISRRYGRSRKAALQVDGALAAMRDGYFEMDVIAADLAGQDAEWKPHGADWDDPDVRGVLPERLFPAEMEFDEVERIITDVNIWEVGVMPAREAVLEGGSVVGPNIVVDEKGMRVHVVPSLHGDSVLYLSLADQYKRVELLLRLLKAALLHPSSSEYRFIHPVLYLRKMLRRAAPVDIALPVYDRFGRDAVDEDAPVLSRMMRDIDPATPDELVKFLEGTGVRTGADNRKSPLDRLYLFLCPDSGAEENPYASVLPRGVVYWTYADDPENAWVLSTTWNRIDKTLKAAAASRVVSYQDDRARGVVEYEWMDERGFVSHWVTRLGSDDDMIREATVLGLCIKNPHHLSKRAGGESKYYSLRRSTTPHGTGERVYTLEVNRAGTPVEVRGRSNRVPGFLMGDSPEFDLDEAERQNVLCLCEFIREGLHTSAAPPQLLPILRKLVGYERMDRIFRDTLGRHLTEDLQEKLLLAQLHIPPSPRRGTPRRNPGSSDRDILDEARHLMSLPAF